IALRDGAHAEAVRAEAGDVVPLLGRQAGDVETDRLREAAELARMHEARSQADVAQARHLHVAGVRGIARYACAAGIVLRAAQPDVEELVVREERRRMAARAAQRLERAPAMPLALPERR